MNAQQIAKRVFILIPIEPSHDRSSLRPLTSKRRSLQSLLQSIQKLSPHSVGRLIFSLRRHLATSHLIEDPRPGFLLGRIVKRELRLLQIERRLRLLPAMTVRAMLFDEA